MFSRNSQINHVSKLDENMNSPIIDGIPFCKLTVFYCWIDAKGIQLPIDAFQWQHIFLFRAFWLVGHHRARMNIHQFTGLIVQPPLPSRCRIQSWNFVSVSRWPTLTRVMWRFKQCLYSDASWVIVRALVASSNTARQEEMSYRIPVSVKFYEH